MNLRLLVTSSLLGMSLVACGGGGSAPTPIGASTNSAVVQSVGVPAAGAASGGLTPYTLSALTPATLSALNLASAPVISIPSGLTPSGTINVGNTNPTGIPTLSAAKGNLKPQSTLISGATALIYAGFNPTASLTIPSGSGISLSFGFSSTPSSDANYHLAFFDGNSWTADTYDTGVVNGSVVTVTLNTPQAITLNSGGTYALALYSIAKNADTGATLSSAGNFAVTTSATNYSGSVLGATATATIPGASSNATLPYSFSTSAPQGVTAPTQGVTSGVVGYAKVSPASTLTFASGSTISASGSYPNVTPSGTYKVAVSTNGTTWTYGVASSTINGSKVSISYTSTAAITLSAGTSYYAALYQ